MKQFAEVSIENVKKYWNKRPCNIRHSPKELGTREYYDEVETRKYFVEPHIPEFAEFEKWKGKKVLEIGCGIGTDTINFARAGAIVTAVDLSDKSLELARIRAEIFDLDINFHQGDVENLSKVIPVDEYDLVYCFGVIHHTPHPEKAIDEMRNFMGRDSILKLMVYNRYSWKVLWVLMNYGKGQFWNLDKWIAKYSEAQTGCPVTYTYTTETIKELLRGFHISDIMIDHIFPYSISEYAKYRYNKVWYFRIMPKSTFRLLEKKLGWHLCVTAELA